MSPCINSEMILDHDALLYLIPVAALDVEPPVAHEPVLVEDGPVRAEERVRGENGAEAANAKAAAADRGGDADVEGLAAGLQVSVVTFEENESCC